FQGRVAFARGVWRQVQTGPGRRTCASAVLVYRALAVLAAAFSCSRFFLALILAIRGASACCWAHCGWMPSREWLDDPQTGQILGDRPPGKVMGPGFLWLIGKTPAEKCDGQACSHPPPKHEFAGDQRRALSRGAVYAAPIARCRPPCSNEQSCNHPPRAANRLPTAATR